VGTDAVGSLSAPGASAESIRLTAPSSAGTYYYGACVDTVTGESDTANNCSSAVRVTVGRQGGGNTFGVGDTLPGVPAAGRLFPVGDWATAWPGVEFSGTLDNSVTNLIFDDGEYIQLRNGTRYSCRASGGCRVRNGVVSRGTIVRSRGTPPATAPDLTVGSPSVNDSSPDAGASFTLRATVRNGGDGRSAATTLRYYRSSNATISTSDTEVGRDSVSGLAASGTSAESIRLTAPSRAGTYYYGACVETVSGESDTTNNCSSAVRVTVSSSVVGGGACTAGLVVNPGESCTYKGHTFSVSSSGQGSIAFFRAGSSIRNSGTINGVRWDFHASKNSGSNSWTIHRAN